MYINEPGESRTRNDIARKVSTPNHSKLCLARAVNTKLLVPISNVEWVFAQIFHNFVVLVCLIPPFIWTEFMCPTFDPLSSLIHALISRHRLAKMHIPKERTQRIHAENYEYAQVDLIWAKSSSKIDCFIY